MKRIFLLLAICVSALAHAQLPNVMLCGAEGSSSTWPGDVQAKLVATGLFSQVDYFNASTATPTLAQLQGYKAVLVWSDAYFNDPTTLGNNLAAYVDGGGGVVTMAFTNTNAPSGLVVGGAFNTAAYQVAAPSNGQSGGSGLTLGTVLLPSHPIMQGVTSFNGGTASYHSANSTLNPNAFVIANWSNNIPLVMGRTGVGTNGANRAELNFYPPSSNARGDFWVASTDGAKLMANALVWVSTSISTGIIGGSPLYQGSAVSVPFTISGTYNSGNVFTAQLSDASGSFASPVTLGTLTSTAAGTITGNIPVNAVAGTGYKIRVISSNPAITGSSSALTVLPSQNALSFGAASDLALSNTNVGISGVQPRTLEFYGTIANNYQHQVNWGIVTTNNAFGTYSNSGGLLMFYAHDGNDFSTGFAGDNQKHHVAVTYDGSFVRVYVDGALTPAGAVARTLATTDGKLYLGNRMDGIVPFNGTLDEVRVWNRALCQAEIVNNMNKVLPNPATQNGLVLYYTFDRGIPSGTNTGITTLTDASAGGNNATLYGFTLIGSSSNFIASTIGASTAATFVPPATASGATQTLTISGSTVYANYCNAIATITPSGSGPAVSGSVTTQVTIDGSVQSYLGKAYVQRHYDIEPATTPNTATATITLYFTQPEFTAYNAANGAVSDLPTGPADAAGIAALRITQYHGTSASHTPGTYTGWMGAGAAVVTITPTTVSWNATGNRWEVTFPVAGFSGFFAAGTGLSATPLPLQLLTFTAAPDRIKGNRITWTVAKEEANTIYSIERSGDGRGFSRIASVGGAGTNQYAVTDAQPFAGNNYYRLKIVEADGSSYSAIALVKEEGAGGTTLVSPVPATGSIRIISTDASALNGPATITSMEGRLMHRFMLTADQELDIRSWPAGTYSLKLGNGEVVRVVKQ